MGTSIKDIPFSDRYARSLTAYEMLRDEET